MWPKDTTQRWEAVTRQASKNITLNIYTSSVWLSIKKYFPNVLFVPNFEIKNADTDTCQNSHLYG